MCGVGWSQLLKHLALRTSSSKASHRPITWPKIREIGDGCLFPLFILSGTLKMGIYSEKTVCFQLSTAKTSAQSISNASSSNCHHSLSTCPEHIPPHTTCFHLNFGCTRRSVRGLGTQFEWQKSGYPWAQPRLSGLNLRCPHSTLEVPWGTQRITIRDPVQLLSHSTIPLKKSSPL